jgi:neutral amino acid transport system permease protein
MRSVLGAMLLAGSVLALMPFPAFGQEADTGVRVRLQHPDEAAGGNVPAVGVGFSVSAEDGTVVGSGVTDEEGVFFLPIETAGRYFIAIDATTLPEGIALTNPDRATATVTVDAGNVASALFGLQVGESTGEETSGGITARAVAQRVLDGLKLGLFLAMGAIGLSLIFGTTGLTNFAHGELITWGMLGAFFFNVYGLVGAFPFNRFMEGWPAPFGEGVDLIIASVFAVLLGVGFGWLSDFAVFAPLRRRGTGLIAQMVITIGLGLLLRYVFLFIFGGSSRFFVSYAGQRESITILGATISPKDLIAMVVSVLALVAIGLVLQRTRFGRAMRAVADNRDLASSTGIDVQRVIRQVWMAAGGLSALGGVFLGQSDQVIWDGGNKNLLLIFASVTLGGLGTAYGALVGSILVGLGIQLSTLFIPVELKNVGALLLMILVLLVRPQGVLGRKERIG